MSGTAPARRHQYKKTIRGACGRVHRTWYDRKVRRVRDLTCGDTRVYLELEVRRVACRSCGEVNRDPHWLAELSEVETCFLWARIENKTADAKADPELLDLRRRIAERAPRPISISLESGVKAS